MLPSRAAPTRVSSQLHRVSVSIAAARRPRWGLPTHPPTPSVTCRHTRRLRRSRAEDERDNDPLATLGKDHAKLRRWVYRVVGLPVASRGSRQRPSRPLVCCCQLCLPAGGDRVVRGQPSLVAHCRRAPALPWAFSQPRQCAVCAATARAVCHLSTTPLSHAGKTTCRSKRSDAARRERRELTRSWSKGGYELWRRCLELHTSKLPELSLLQTELPRNESLACFQVV